MRHYGSEDWLDYIQGKCSSLESMLMEEHMAGCEKCLQEYVSTLETLGLAGEVSDKLCDRIMGELEDNKAGIHSAGKRFSRLRLMLRYTVAASIALFLWQAGVFTGVSSYVEKIGEHPRGEINAKITASSGYGDKMVEGINSMFDYITKKGDELFDGKKK